MTNEQKEFGATVLIGVVGGLIMLVVVLLIFTSL